MTEDAWGDPMPGRGVAGVDRGSGKHEKGKKLHGSKAYKTVTLSGGGTGGGNGGSGGGSGGGSSGFAALGLPDPLARMSLLAPSLLHAQTTASCTMIVLLLKAGCDVFQRTRDGRTALHEAIRRSVPEAARALLAFGADHEARDEHGLTPLGLWQHQKQNSSVGKEGGGGGSGGGERGKELTKELTMQERSTLERRDQIGKMLKSWAVIRKENEMSEFYVSWLLWLRSPEVSRVKFTGLHEALRDVRLDELVMVKAQVVIVITFFVVVVSTFTMVI